jgi:hypothetical protein
LVDLCHRLLPINGLCAGVGALKWFGEPESAIDVVVTQAAFIAHEVTLGARIEAGTKAVNNTLVGVEVNTAPCWKCYSLLYTISLNQSFISFFYSVANIN